MKAVGKCVCVALGVAAGVVGTMFYLGQPRQAGAASNDRYQDNIMATGAVSVNPRIQTDGVWLLDYRAGKLLGTVIDRTQGKIVGWAEVDLRTEFEITAQQDVHFMMTTGYVTQGQSALYLAETSTGKFGVYTMGPGANGSGVGIRRHDMTTFRQPVNPAPSPASTSQPPAAAPPTGATNPPATNPPGATNPPATNPPGATTPPTAGGLNVPPPLPGGSIKPSGN